MNPAAEPCLLGLNRAYCYLRLAGLDPATACRQLHELIALLAESDAAMDEGAAWREEHWQRVLARAAAAPVPDVDGLGALPLLRGHLHYPDPWP